MKWCVHNPMMGDIVIVTARSAASAAKRGVEALAEHFTQSSCCPECESVTVAEVEVWPLDQEKRETFRVESNWKPV